MAPASSCNCLLKGKGREASWRLLAEVKTKYLSIECLEGQMGQEKPLKGH